MILPAGDHFCPGCGQRLPAYPRYPWYLCQTCLGSVTDAGGRQVEFANVSISGGFAWRLVGDRHWTEGIQYLGYIRGRPVVVAEHYMGGILVQPAGR